MTEKKFVEIYTDGSCLKNPGPGGWGAVLIYNGIEKEMSGGERDTTNNRMELTAAIKSLEALKVPCKVKMTTDSKYLCDGMGKGWAVSWKKKAGVKATTLQRSIPTCGRGCLIYARSTRWNSAG